jgi:hypothetical protein
MQIDIPHFVTKASDDGTFQVGDRIRLLSDGAILCIQAKGWISTKRMLKKLSKVWSARSIKSS